MRRRRFRKKRIVRSYVDYTGIVFFIILFSMCALYAHFFPPTSEELEEKTESKQAFAYMNELRENESLNPIAWDDRVYILAVNRSKDMYTRNYFDHVTPEGKCVKDMKNSYGLKDWILAENVGAEAYNQEKSNMSFSRSIDAKNQIDRWMESRGHRYNLLYTEHEIGAIGCYGGVCTFLGGHRGPYGLGAGPCTTGEQGLIFWKIMPTQPGEVE